MKQNSKSAAIKKHLLQNIRQGQIKDRIPSENQLAQSFKVSRMTARKVLTELESEGLVERIQGRGTFVKKQDLSVAYFKVQPSKKQAESLSLSHSSSVLELSLLDAPPVEIAEKLKYDGESVFLRRIHFFDDRPVRYEIRYLRGDLCSGILNEDLEKNSVHELLVNQYKLPLSKVRQRITAVTMPKDIANIFQEKAGYPAFYIERLTFTDKKAVTFVKYYIRGEIGFEDEFAPAG